MGFAILRKESTLILMRNLTHLLSVLAITPIILIGPAHISVAHAQTTASIPETSKSLAKPKASKTRVEKLDALFTELKREPNQRKAKVLASQIAINWTSSGSHTANALMAWAQQAMKSGQHNKALELLDQVIALVPDYSEGWNRRATLHYMMRNHTKSMADIEQTLALEPRHFGALSGMASILAVRGNDDKALKVYEHVLSIYPANRTAQASIMKLMQKLEKSEI